MLQARKCHPSGGYFGDLPSGANNICLAVVERFTVHADAGLINTMNKKLESTLRFIL